MSALSPSSDTDLDGTDTAAEAGQQPPAYEQARDELADIVRQLESGSANLADCLKLWERGEYLASVCQTHLESAIERVEQANPAATGTGAQRSRKDQSDPDAPTVN